MKSYNSDKYEFKVNRTEGYIFFLKNVRGETGEAK